MVDTMSKEHLKGYALDFVNKLAREFGNPEIQAFQPGHLCCDCDTFTRACEAAVGVEGLMVSWGENDGKDCWLSFWGLSDEQIVRVAMAVGRDTSSGRISVMYRRNDEQITEIVQPAPITEFGNGLLEGDFPELVVDD